MKQKAFLLVVLSFSIAHAHLSHIETNILNPLAYNRNGNESWAAGEWSNNSVHPLDKLLALSRFFYDPEAKRHLEHGTSQITSLRLNNTNSLTE